MRFYTPGKFDPQDYPEDEEPQGKGIYHCICCNCDCQFWGYKARLVCKVCDEKYQAQLAAMTPKERAEHEAEKLQKLIDAYREIETRTGALSSAQSEGE